MVETDPLDPKNFSSASEYSKDNHKPQVAQLQKDDGYVRRWAVICRGRDMFISVGQTTQGLCDS